MIKHVVIPAAGLGTRLLPVTKETPKEMLPIFSINLNGDVFFKPILQVIFEQMYDIGFRHFCFIVREGKQGIKKHFTPDNSLIHYLNEKENGKLVDEMNNFYEKVNSSSLVFVNQLEHKGFGDAVLLAEPYVEESFIVQAGDTYVISHRHSHMTRLITEHSTNRSAATFLVRKVEDPKPFGIIEGIKIRDGLFRVNGVVEKPEEPPSNLAITGVYVMNPIIFNALRSIRARGTGELQLTEGIQWLINSGYRVMAVEMDEKDLWLDIGNPQAYLDALNRSQNYAFTNGRTQRERKLMEATAY